MTAQPISSASAHLSDEVLDDLLIGLVSAETQPHLAACELCRGKLEAFRLDLQTFNRASLLWSESKPLFDLRSAAAKGTTRHWAISPRWAIAVVMLLVLGVALLRYPRGPASNSRASAGPVAVDYQAQIAEDNQMLQSVEMALNDNEPAAIDEYHLPEVPHQHPKTKLGSRLESRHP